MFGSDKEESTPTLEDHAELYGYHDVLGWRIVWYRVTLKGGQTPAWPSDRFVVDIHADRVLYVYERSSGIVVKILNGDVWFQIENCVKAPGSRDLLLIDQCTYMTSPEVAALNNPYK